MYERIVPRGRVARVDEFLRFNGLKPVVTQVPQDVELHDEKVIVHSSGKLISEGRVVPFTVE